ncbi:MAG: hypothetical protein RIC38_10205, partial [Chromatocurvus sp.]
WQSEDALQVPSSALFQHGGEPAVFRIADNRVALQAVATGQSNGLMTQVLAGLEADDRVVRHPGRELNDGDRIRTR